MKLTLASRVAASALLLCATFSTMAQVSPAAGKPIAVQMYSLRNAGSLEDQLKIVHAAGLHAVETVGTQDATAPQLKQLLDRYSITAIASHAQLAELRSDFAGVVAFNKAIGNRVLVVPYLQREQRPTDVAGWTRLGRELGELARKARGQGMTLAYHNHDFEIVDLQGKTALEWLFAAAGPDLQAELDLAWIARAGHDPAALLGKFKGRVFAVHAKDNAPAGQAEDEGGFAAVGQGVLDWNRILPAAADAGVKWYVIEHDQPRDPAAVIQAGAGYLRRHLPAAAGR